MIETVLQQLVNGLGTGMGYALVALGLTLIFGVLHVINFAHGELFMLGAFGAVLATTRLGVPYLLAVALGVVAVCIVAAVLDRIAIRPLLPRREGRSDVLLATFAVSLLLYHGVLGAWGPAPERLEGLDGSVSIGPVTLTYQRMLVIGGGLAVVAALDLLLRRSAFGREMRAVAQNAFAARVVGIDVPRVGTRTFVLAAGVAALAGGLLAPIVLFSPLMGQNAVLKAFVVVVIGGMGNIPGAVVCGIGLGILEALLVLAIPEGFTAALLYALLVAGLLVRPQGLFGPRTA